MITNYLLHIFILACIHASLTMSVNLNLGYGGMINLSYIGVYAIGAYTSALLTLSGFPFWIGLVSGACLAGLAGYLMSYPTAKLRGDYLMIGTLGFSFIIEQILLNWSSLTRGPMGLPGIPKAELFGFTFKSLQSYALLMLVVAVLTYVVLKLVVDSPYGRILKSIRDDEIAAKTLGKDTFKTKAKAMALSAFLVGSIGSFYAHYITYIDPTGYTIMQTILILSMVLVGGTGSLSGSVVGAVFITLLPEPLRFLNLPPGMTGGLRQGLYALILILIILYRPQGILGEDTLHNAWQSMKKRMTT